MTDTTTNAQNAVVAEHLEHAPPLSPETARRVARILFGSRT